MHRRRDCIFNRNPCSSSRNSRKRPRMRVPSPEEGRPRDVSTRQKVKIVLKSGGCVSAESVQAISHAASAATPLQFKNDTSQTKSSLELDADCATSVLITKLF